MAKIAGFVGLPAAQKTLLRGISVAMYIVGQERRLVDPPSQVVAGVRTVTTKMDGRCDPHVAAPILFVTSRRLRACVFVFCLFASGFSAGTKVRLHGFLRRFDSRISFA